MLDYLFGAASFLPHGFCLLWRPDLVALHVVSDLAIGLAYFSIPVAIVAYLRRKPDFEYRGTAGLFATFIVLCGFTHIMGLATLWWPAYGLDGMLKAVTAVVSVVTAISLWPLLPKIIEIPSPWMLQKTNARLEQEIAERLAAEAALRQMHAELERRVLERTAELARSEERARLAAEAGNVGLWDWDLTTDAIQRSPETKAVLAMEGDPPAQTFLDRIHPEDREQVQSILETALVEGTLRAEIRLIHPGGGVRWADIRGTVFKNMIEGEIRPVRFLGTLMDITDRMEATEAIRRSLREKETLITEIHHRVKNNLQSLLALVQMEGRKLQDPALLARLGAIRDRIKVMARIHQSLYASGVLSAVNFGSQLAELCRDLQTFLPEGQVEISVGVEELYCSLDTAVPLGLLANEVVSNAVRHAFPNGRPGRIGISLRQVDDLVVLVIADDGIGQAGSATSGTGMDLVRALARQLGASVSSVAGAGTTVIVSLPAAVFANSPNDLPPSPTSFSQGHVTAPAAFLQ
jgi:two-component sensor histidine kinase/PAS domain-containing protein